MKKKKVWKSKKCQNCGRRMLDVKKRPDKYEMEINENYKATYIVCDDCDEKNTENI